jgi:hypothetical protein
MNACAPKYDCIEITISLSILPLCSSQNTQMIYLHPN